MKDDNAAAADEEEFDLGSIVDEVTERGFDANGEILPEGEEPVVIDEDGKHEEGEGKEAAEEADEKPEGQEDQSDQAGEGEAGETAKADSEEVEGDQPDDDNQEADAQEGETELSNEDFAKTITKKRTRERFEKLHEDMQGLDTKYQELEQQHNTIMQVMKDTGCSNDELGQLLDIGAALKQGDFETALPLIQPMLDLIAQNTGKTIGSADPLANHSDLLEQVDDMTLTRAQAEEIAVGRNYQTQQQQTIQVNQQQQQQQSQQQVNQEQFQGRQQAGTQAIDTWAVKLAKSDPDFQRYEDQITKFLTNDIQAGLPPEQYVQRAQRYYDQLKSFAKGVNGNGQARPGANTLRGRSDSRQTKIAAPATVEDAVDQALDGMYAQ